MSGLISQLENINELLTYGIMLRFAHSSVRTICNNADRITESAKSGPKMFV